jgi:hypothetical protein
MKLAITKLADGRVEVALTARSDKKPLKLTLDERQLDLFQQLLSTAKNADSFAFILEL